LLKKSITYEDPFTDEMITEDHFFHLSKAELVELELSETGGLSNKLQRIVEQGDANDIIRTFKDLVLRSYGLKTHDNKFKKSPEISADFETSPAYSALFMELVTDAEKAAEFVNGVVPQGLENEMDKLREQRQAQERENLEQKTGNVFEDNDTSPVTTPPPGTPRVLTIAEAHAMDQAELAHLLSTGQVVLGDSSGG